MATVLSGWSFDPQIIIPLVALGALYWSGTASTLATLPKNHRLRPRPWRAALFYVSLLLVVLALESPLDDLAHKVLWAHMVQHLILIMLVPQLMLLSDPALALMRGLPIAMRRRAFGAALGWRWVHALGAMVVGASRPVPAFALFAVTLWAWHWPALYNLALRDQGLHDLEHLMFLVTAVLFWLQVIPSPPLRPVLGYRGRATYLAGGLAQNVALSMLLGFAPAALYAPYAALAQRPGGISALADQQIGAAIMWSVGDVPFVLALVILVQMWLRAQMREACTAGEKALVG